jgi:hypothetical protein
MPGQARRPRPQRRPRRVSPRAIERVLATLAGRYDSDRFPRNRRAPPYRVLVSCILSLRTKNEVTDAASARLFARARDPRSMLQLRAAVLGVSGGDEMRAGWRRAEPMRDGDRGAPRVDRHPR